MTNHEAEEDNNESEIIRESIFERQLSRGDWLLVNYDNANKGEKWKWLKKEDKIIYKRPQIFEKLNPPEVASSQGQFIFKDITLRLWVCIILFLHAIINCSRNVLLIQKIYSLSGNILIISWEVKIGWPENFVVIVYCHWIQDS